MNDKAISGQRSTRRRQIAGRDCRGQTFCHPGDIDDGVRDAVVLLWNGGFRTFTSCEGGRGHSFQHETIGLKLEENYAAFQRRLVRFLRSQGMENFSVSLVTDYHPGCPRGRKCVYLGGLDILSPRKRKQVLETSRRREQRAIRQLRELGIEVPRPGR